MPSRSCLLAPEHDRGEYYVPDAPVRSDLRQGTAGAPLMMQVRVVDAAGCAPLSGVVVDVWHADALGTYSSGSGPQGMALRGVQPTGPDGIAAFRTIVPGWYPGRASHVHVTVRSVTPAPPGSPVVAHTGTIFFDDDVVAIVAGQPPYRDNVVPRTPLAIDPVFREGGARTLSSMRPLAAGFVSDVTIAVAVRR